MKKFLWIIIGAIGIVAILFFLGYKGKERKYFTSQKKKDFPLIRVEGINFTEWNEKGEKIWIILADSGEEFKQKIVFNKVKVTFLEKNAPVSEAEAGRVTVDLRTSNLTMQGGIKIISCLDKAELSTSTLEWKASEKKLLTEDKITFKRGNLITEGKGLVADINLSQVIIKSEIITRLKGGKI